MNFPAMCNRRKLTVVMRRSGSQCHGEKGLPVTCGEGKTSERERGHRHWTSQPNQRFSYPEHGRRMTVRPVWAKAIDISNVDNDPSPHLHPDTV